MLYVIDVAEPEPGLQFSRPYFTEKEASSSTWNTTLSTPLPNLALNDSTFLSGWVGMDGVYRNSAPALVFTLTLGADPATGSVQVEPTRIMFWSPSTGLREIVDTTIMQQVANQPSGPLSYNNAGSRTNTLSLDHPTIGVTTSGTIQVTFHAATRDTASNGNPYCNIYYTQSTDGGTSWSIPVALIPNATAGLDYFNASIAPYNPNGTAHIIYSEDPEPYVSVAHFTTGSQGSPRRVSFFHKKLDLSTISFVYRVIPQFSNTRERENNVAQSFRLAQNYPNPFNPTTNISYVLPRAENVSLKIYDVLGREVATLVNEAKAQGAYTVPFNASNLASGVYFYKLQAGSFVQTKKMMLVK
jgi:hypothetical protein